MFSVYPLAEMGKVFVGGLSRDTTTTGLRVYFERFGQISDCVVMKDRSTGAPRGFGFVTYRNQTIADHVVSQRHLIDGKEVEAKPAVPRDSETLLRAGLAVLTVAGAPVQPPLSSSAGHLPQPGELKIFVGGLSHETSELEFVSHFGTLALPCPPCRLLGLPIHCMYYSSPFVTSLTILLLQRHSVR